MGIQLWRAALAGLLGVISATAPAAPVERHIHYRDCGGLICLEVPIGGQRELFTLDTGNPSSTIDLDLAKRLGLELTPAIRRNHPEETLQGIFKTGLPDTVVSDLDLVAPRIIAMNLGDFRKALGTPIAGTLAYASFKDRKLLLDPKHHVMTVTDAADTPAGPAPAGAQRYTLRLVTFGSDGPPVLTAESVTLNGHAFLAQLDTEFPEAALLFPPARDALGLQQAKPVGRRVLGYYDDNAELLRLPAGAVGFGDPLFAGAGRHVFLPGKGVHFPDNEIALVVGTGWFRGHPVTLDLHDMTLTVAPIG